MEDVTTVKLWISLVQKPLYSHQCLYSCVSVTANADWLRDGASRKIDRIVLHSKCNHQTTNNTSNMESTLLQRPIVVSY